MAFDYLAVAHGEKTLDIFSNKRKRSLRLKNAYILLIKNITRIIYAARTRETEPLARETTKHYV